MYPTTTADGREIHRVTVDMFDDSTKPGDWLLHALFADIDATQAVTVLVTRYPERAQEMWPETPCRPGLICDLARPTGIACPPDSCDVQTKVRPAHRPNIILLIHCETQAEVNAAASHLAALSQLCGVVGLELVPREMIDLSGLVAPLRERKIPCQNIYAPNKIRWLTIHGGDEPCHPDCIRGPIRQAEAAQVPVWFGGWGEWLPVDQWDEDDFDGETVVVRHDGAIFGATEPNWGCCANCSFVESLRVGPARSGRTLDGRTLNGVPVMPINS